jgi:hypothetical protein
MNAVVYAKYSAIASRSSRGRTYIPGPPEADVADGRITDAEKANWVAAVDGIEDDLTVAAQGNAVFTPTIFSLKRFELPTTPYYYDITKVVLRTRIATQRRRRTRTKGFA